MDIPNGVLFRFDPATGDVARVVEGAVLGAATLQRDGSLALLGFHGEVWCWRGEQRVALATIPAMRGTRFNDAIADRTGRILGGTMPTRTQPSALYSIEPDGDHRVVISGLGQSNGMALSDDQHTLYHVDTRARVVRAYPYDEEHGTTGTPRILARFAGTDVVPDGMALDEEGCLWVAMWGGGCVVRLDASGERVGTMRVPTPLVSSVAFGGPHLSDLYITTAGRDDRERHGPLAGSLFIARPDVRGVERHRSALRIA